MSLFSPNAFSPIRDAHDDGPFNGLSVGGIGTGNFGRDLHGHFSRWHLQQGIHCKQVIDAARLNLRWHQQDRSGFHQLGTAGWSSPLPDGIRSVHILFPATLEYYAGKEWPFEMIMEIYRFLVFGVVFGFDWVCFGFVLAYIGFDWVCFGCSRGGMNFHKTLL